MKTAGAIWPLIIKINVSTSFVPGRIGRGGAPERAGI